MLPQSGVPERSGKQPYLFKKKFQSKPFCIMRRKKEQWTTEVHDVKKNWNILQEKKKSEKQGFNFPKSVPAAKEKNPNFLIFRKVK